jgi:outer membrane protein TolC
MFIFLRKLKSDKGLNNIYSIIYISIVLVVYAGSKMVFKRFKMFFTLSLVFLINTKAVHCIEARTVKLNIKEAIELAEKNNLAIMANSMNLDIATNNIKTANKLQNPELFTFYNFGRAGRGNPQQIGLAQTIELGKRTARKNVAKSNFDLINDTYKYNQFNLDMNVREAYINLVVAKSFLNIVDEQKELLEELLRELERTNRKGDEEAQLEIMQTEIALNLIIAKENTAKVNIDGTKLDFNKILNLKNDIDINYDSVDENLLRDRDFVSLLTPLPDDDLPEFEEIKNKAFDKRFDLKIKKDEIKLAEKELILVLKQRIPNLEIAGGYSFQPNNQSNGEGYLSGAYAGLNITNIPFLYNYSPEIKNAQLELEQAKLRYASTKNIAEHEFESAYKRFKMAKINLSHYDEKILDKSHELLRIAKKSFKDGKSTLTTFILIEQSHIDVQTNYIEALSEYYKSWLDFLRVVNTEEFNLTRQTL